MKKFLSILLGTVMLASLLAACGTNGDTSEAAPSKPSEASAQDTGNGEQTVIRMTYWNAEDSVSELLAYLEKAVPDVKIEF